MGQVVKLPQPEGWESLELFLFERKAEGKAPRTIYAIRLTLPAFLNAFSALRSEKDFKNFHPQVFLLMILNLLLLTFAEYI